MFRCTNLSNNWFFRLFELPMLCPCDILGCRSRVPGIPDGACVQPPSNQTYQTKFSKLNELE